MDKVEIASRLRENRSKFRQPGRCIARLLNNIVLTSIIYILTSMPCAHALVYVYNLTGTDISLYQASGHGPASPTSPVATLRLTIDLVNPLVYPDSPYDYGPTPSSVRLEGSNITILQPTTFEYNPGFPQAYPASMRLGDSLNFGQCCYDAADAGTFDVAGYLEPGSNSDPIDYTTFSPILVAFTDTYDNIFFVNAWTLSEQTLSSGAAPEPAAWALMILGFWGVGWTLRRATGRKDGKGRAPTTAGASATTQDESVNWGSPATAISLRPESEARVSVRR